MKPDKGFNITGAPMPTTKRRIDMDGPDYYPTPAWATRALIEHHSAIDEPDALIWEPACGDGAMASELGSYGRSRRVLATDLFYRGFGSGDFDFLNIAPSTIRNMVGLGHSKLHIITNPPFHSATQFALKGLEYMEMVGKYHAGSVCLLLRTAFLEGGNRFDELFDRLPPTHIHVFSERVTFYPAGDERQGTGGGTTSYSWFRWDAVTVFKPHFTKVTWIKPGTRARLSDVT